MFLAQLQLVRLALCGKTVRVEGHVGGPGEPRIDRGADAGGRPAGRLRTVAVRELLKVLLRRV
jgi:hypothetical protein